MDGILQKSQSGPIHMTRPPPDAPGACLVGCRHQVVKGYRTEDLKCRSWIFSGQRWKLGKWSLKVLKQTVWEGCNSVDVMNHCI